MRSVRPHLIAPLIVMLSSLAPLPVTAEADQSVWVAGPYSFSDERGGFTIRSVSGKGTTDDPFVLVEELHSASPVTLVIRAATAVRPFGSPGGFATGFLHMRIEAINGSGQAWVEFEFELQEILGRSSTFGDGLSFDQRKTTVGASGEANTDTAIGTGSFASFSRDFEPYDRLLFRDGHVDPGMTATFDFLITDYTPKRLFYLIQDPRIPYS